MFYFFLCCYVDVLRALTMHGVYSVRSAYRRIVLDSVIESCIVSTLMGNPIDIRN